MKRKLLKQVLNEWHINLWISLELFIVSVVVTVAVYSVYVNLRTYHMPMNLDKENTYSVAYAWIPNTSERYDTEAAKLPRPTQKYNFYRALRNHPIVEAAAMSVNCQPYSFGTTGSPFRADTTLEYIQIRICDVSPDYPKVFKYIGINGETPEQLAQVIKDGKVIITRNLFDEQGVNSAGLINKTIYGYNNEPLTVGAVVEAVRWNEYVPDGETLIKKVSDLTIGADNLNIAVRIQPDFSGNVVETLMSEVHSGNLYITGVYDMRDLKKNALLDKDNEVRNQIVMVAFLLFNLFLGILGTFWLRTSQRKGEIAIRKVNGATTSSVMGRLIAEGVLIVAFVSVLSFPVAGIVLKILSPEIFTWSDTSICAAFSFVAIGCMTIVGTLIPALKAIRINPSEVLKSE